MAEKKFFQNKTKRSEGLFRTKQNDEKSALSFNSVYSVTTSKKFSFKEKTEVNNIFQSFE